MALSGCATTAGFSGADDTAIRSLFTAQRDAWNQGQLEKFMEGYERSPNLIFTSGGTIERGWQGALDRYRKRYGVARSTMGTLSFDVLDVRPLGSDGAVVLGRWGLVLDGKQPGGVFTVVLLRGPSGWKIVHDHTSSDPQDSDPPG